MIHMSVLLTTMLELFAFIIVGWILAKTKQLDQETNKKLSGLVVNVLSPALIISSVCVTNDFNDQNIVWQALVFGIALYIILIIISKIIVLFLHVEKNDRSVYELMSVFANTAFIGYPILRVLYGDFSVFIFSLLHLSYNILIYSYGVYLIQKGKNQKDNHMSYRSMISMGSISSFIAIVIYLSHMIPPAPVVDFLSTLGEATIPLSMIVIGVSLGFQSLKDIMNDKKIYSFIVIKLCILPIFLFFTVYLLPIDTFIKELIVISGTLPTGSMVVIFSNQYEGNIKAASAGVFLTTLCSIITIPIMLNILLNLI